MLFEHCSNGTKKSPDRQIPIEAIGIIVFNLLLLEGVIRLKLEDAICNLTFF
jgi:hypothetical protein